MKSKFFLIMITIIVIITAFSAGCIEKDSSNISNEDLHENFEFNTSAYILTDEINDTDIKTVISKTYTFMYEEKLYIVNVNVPQYRINNYKADMFKLYDYQRGFVKDNYIEDVVEQIKQQVNTNDRQKLAKVLIAFVQEAIGYDTDMNVHGKIDYWAYPVETLINGVGDCDCKAILMTAILRTAGFDALTLLQSKHLSTIVSDINPYVGTNSINTNVYDTNAMLIYKGKNYYFIDSTSSYGVGCYTKELTESLKEYYTIYDETETSAWINTILEETVKYQHVM